MTRTPAQRSGPDERPAEEELLIDGQEEVFSRTEVENGRIEHHARAGSASDEIGAAPVEPARQRR